MILAFLKVNLQDKGHVQASCFVYLLTIENAFLCFQFLIKQLLWNSNEILRVVYFRATWCTF